MSNTVAVIIPVFNNLDYTKKLLNSIENHKFTRFSKLIICIVDNASTDSTYSYLSKEWSSNLFIKTGIIEEVTIFKEVSSYEDKCKYIVKSPENFGFAKAVNYGVKAVLLDYPDADIIIMNNDMEVIDGCFDNLYDCAYSTKEIGIVGGRLLFGDGKIQHGGAFLNLFGWGQHKGAGELDNEFNNYEICEQEYVTGALLFIKNELIRKLNNTLFDERFSPVYFEEVDLSYESRKLGYKTFYTPYARAYHFENVTGKEVYKNLEKVNEISRKNQIKFYLKRENDNYVPTSEKKILFICKIYGEWSFAGVMRNLAKGLSRNEVDVSIAPEEYHIIGNMEDWEIKQMINKPKDYWNRYVLRSSEGDHMYLLPPGKKRIAHTTGESSCVHKGWVEQLNNVDLVLTTSTFFKNVLEDSGVKTKISILPNSIDTKMYNPNIKALPVQGLRSLNFLSIFHFGERKDPEKVFKAFIEEFGPDDDVTLTVHSLSMAFILQRNGKTISQWVKEISGGKPHPPIWVTSDYIHESVMPHFMKNYDVFVLPSRAEGFGLPIVEAAALGIPSIVTGYSGMTDFVTDDCGWKIDYKLVDIPLQILPYFKNYVGGVWADSSLEHLRQLMRYVYNNKNEVKIKGEKALSKAQNYSIEKIGSIAKEIIFNI